MVVALSTDETNDYGGSIGTTWPPGYDAANDRVKGFYTAPVDSIEDLEEPIDRLYGLQAETDAGRITCRALVHDAVMHDVDQQSLDNEAAIDLDGDWHAYHLVYLGAVDNDRQRPEPIEEQHDVILGHAESGYQTVEEQELSYEVRLLDEPTDERIDAMQSLYQDRYTAYPIDFTRENIDDLFDGDNRVAAAYDDEELVGAYVAEVATIPLMTDDPASSIQLAELTEAATARSYEGDGIGTALGQQLLSELTETGIDMVYGEARADLVGVNISAARMGRRFEGVLPNHCQIGGDTDDLDHDLLAETLTNEQYETVISEPYGSLNVWAITDDELTAIFQ